MSCHTQNPTCGCGDEFKALQEDLARLREIERAAREYDAAAFAYEDHRKLMQSWHKPWRAEALRLSVEQEQARFRLRTALEKPGEVGHVEPRSYCPCGHDECDGRVGDCRACKKTGVPIDGQGYCYQCFEDAMFAPDEEPTNARG